MTTFNLSNCPGIEVDPNRCGGVPVVKGTRFPISQILAELADGATVKKLCEDYDFLSPEEVREALHGLAWSLGEGFKNAE